MPTGGGDHKPPNAKQKPFAVSSTTMNDRMSGCPLDTTDHRGLADLRPPGGHNRIDETAAIKAAEKHGVFCAEKHTLRQTPDIYLKKGQGTAGQSGTMQKKQLESEKKNSGGNARHVVLDNPKLKVPKATQPRANPVNSELRRFYERGDLPIQLDHQGVKNQLLWKVDIDQLDFHHYLPIYFSGLREVEEPYQTIATKGCEDMVNQGGEGKILPVIPQLIIPLKTALNTREPLVIVKVCNMLQLMLQAGNQGSGESLIGQALVPYYRQLLPILNIFLNNNTNAGDGIQYNQQRGENLGDKIQDTLELLEIKGGADAFINIKYLVPTYQSADA